MEDDGFVVAEKPQEDDGFVVAEKPQENFRRVLADTSTAPFVHLRIHENGEEMQHPFYQKIHELLENISEAPITLSEANDGPPPLDVPYVWVETTKQLQDLAKILSEEKEFAVDVEHHSFRSFLGFIALIQISTNNQDFLVDAIALHDEMSILRPIFADPKICKVFHGADSDSLWLQRDYHIYIVNLFDTTRACDVLSKPHRSLAYLLQSYCDVFSNKVFQQADWRQRPLPEAMLHYARVDVHYLLYIARRLCKELIEETDGVNGLHEAVRRSHLVSLQLYNKDRSSPSPSTAAASIVARFFYGQGSTFSSKILDTKFLELSRRLCTWRDGLARSEDESLRYILSDAAIAALAKDCPLSHEMILSTIAAADSSPKTSISAVAAALPSPLLTQRKLDFLATLLNQASDASKLQHLATAVPDSEKAPITWSSSIRNGTSVSRFLSKDTMLLNKKDLNKNFKLISDCKNGEPQGSELWKSQKSRYQFVRHFACKAPVYDNCRIYAGDGCLLCYCDRKKIDWYLKRGLAESLNEDPPAIRLLFEPKGRPEDGNNEFYIQRKHNQCVSCGEDGHYLRYRIIPSCYRQHFPEHLKSHRSHDIVLLCVDCHEIAHQAAEQFKKQVAAEYGMPLHESKELDAEDGKDVVGKRAYLSGMRVTGEFPAQIRSAIMALLSYASSMPIQRREELENVIKTYFDGHNITEEEMVAILIAGAGPRGRNRLLKSLQQKSFSETFSLTSGDRFKHLSMQNCSNLDKATAPCEIFTKERNLGVQRSEDCPLAFSRAQLDVCKAKISHFKTCYDHQVDHEIMKSNVCPDTMTYMEEMQTMDQDCRAALSNEATMAISDVCIEGNFSGIPTSTPTMGGFTYSTSDKGSGSQVDGEIRKADALIGHGVHGKKVIAAILEKEGEDGIQRFCQKWRLVFIDALQPAFLPAGWDVSHRGLREFGDFSIYNPRRKIAQPENSSQ